MATNVPLTIQTGIFNNYASRIVFGSSNLQLPSTPVNLYWAVVVDRSNLNVVQNFTFSNNQTVPAQLQPYLNNTQYMLILTTLGLHSDNLPAGAFYQFLQALGSGAALQRLEQVYAALNCGTFGSMGYVLVAIMDNSNGLEYSDVISNTAMVTTLQLVPIQIGSQTLYMPVKLQ